MPLAEATALVAAHVEQHDPHADQAALSQLAAWCEQFSPVVGIEPPDNLCLNVTGLAPLFGSEDALVQQVVRAFQRRSYIVRIAVADTLGAAWAIARFGHESPVVVQPGRTNHALSELPIAALRVSDTTGLLTELGIQTIGQLLAFPRAPFATRFNLELLLRLDQATGMAPEPIVSHRPPPEITVETQLEFATGNRQAVEIILRQLIERVAKALCERQQGIIELECAMSCEEAEPTSYVVGLFRASAHATHLFELTRIQLERIALPGPVTAVRLSVLHSVPLQTWQQELFEPSHQEGRRQVSLLVDRLSSRLGREAVVRAVPQADAQPELAFWYEPLAGVARRTTKQRGKSLPRPLRLESEPVPLEMLAVAPKGPPSQFQFHGCHRVAHAWGPERIQTGWWRGGHVQRDYYRIETTEGKRFWLFRRLSDKKWFLHGVFD
jgi:protein ImuB